MTIYDIELDIHAANGEEVTHQYLYDASREVLLVHSPSRVEYGRTTSLYPVYSGPDIAMIQKVIQDPNDPQRTETGFYILEARVEETPLEEHHLDTILKRIPITPP